MTAKHRIVPAITAAALALTVSPSSPAQAAGPSYIALGDSYSSGTGTRSYVADGTTCQRSVAAYPTLLANSRGLSLLMRACSGATISQVRSLQAPALATDTQFVTVSAGGNDAGFASVLTECALPAWMSNCAGKVNTARATITGTLPGRLDGLYSDLRARSPQANIVAVGYPRVFNGTDCNALTWFSTTEMSQLNTTADLLNSITAQAAARHGVKFVNPTARFSGHAVCDRPEWLNGLSNPISESFHPNASGHSLGYFPLVAQTAPSPNLTVRTTMSSTSLAAQGRRFASLDAAIKPKSVQAVNLQSTRAKLAAARAGVNLSSRASIDAADARFSAAQVTDFAPLRSRSITSPN